MAGWRKRPGNGGSSGGTDAAAVGAKGACGHEPHQNSAAPQQAAGADDPMRLLAHGLLTEACGRTGPRLQQAREMVIGLPEEEALRVATADARRLLASCAAASAPAKRRGAGSLAGEEETPIISPPDALELLKALASVETAAQQLFAAAAAKEAEPTEDCGGEGADSSAKTGAASGAGAQLPDPVAASAPAAGKAAGKAAKSRRRHSAMRVLRGLLWDKDLPAEAVPEAGQSAIFVDNLLLERWCSNDSELWQGDAAMLRRLAEDASKLMQATAVVNNYIVQTSERIDHIEDDAQRVIENTEQGINAIGAASKSKHKRFPLKSTLACTLGGTATGLVLSCPVVAVVAMGAGMGAVGGLATYKVRKHYRRRVERLLRERAASR